MRVYLVEISALFLYFDNDVIINISILIKKMNLDRTVKWIDKTGKLSGIQTEEISSVKLYSTPAEF